MKLFWCAKDWKWHRKVHLLINPYKSPYDQGWDEGCDTGYNESYECPYPEDSKEAEEWKKGYEDGRCNS